MFREKVTSKLTLGQVFDKISRRINEKYSTDVEKPSINPHFEKVNSLIDDCDGNGEMTEDMLKHNREIIALIDSFKKYYDHKFKIVNNAINNISVFPKQILDSIEDLIRYRNAASHKTRIPIGEFEATKCFLNFYRLINWWNHEIESIDWKKNQDEIIEYLAQKNSTADL